MRKQSHCALLPTQATLSVLVNDEFIDNCGVILIQHVAFMSSLQICVSVEEKQSLFT